MGVIMEVSNSLLLDDIGQQLRAFLSHSETFDEKTNKLFKSYLEEGYDISIAAVGIAIRYKKRGRAYIPQVLSIFSLKEGAYKIPGGKGAVAKRVYKIRSPLEGIRESLGREFFEETGVELTLSKAIVTPLWVHVYPADNPEVEGAHVKVVYECLIDPMSTLSSRGRENETSPPEWLDVEEFSEVGLPSHVRYLQRYLSDYFAARIAAQGVPKELYCRT